MSVSPSTQGSRKRKARPSVSSEVSSSSPKGEQGKEESYRCGNSKGPLLQKGIFINRRAAALETDFPTGRESSFLEAWKGCQQDLCQSSLCLSLFLPWSRRQEETVWTLRTVAAEQCHLCIFFSWQESPEFRFPLKSSHREGDSFKKNSAVSKEIDREFKYRLCSP